MESVAEWKSISIGDEEENTGHQHDLPLDQHKEEVQQASLHERKNQPKEVIQEIKELMLRSAGGI
jgi:hypothetical protein